MDDNLKQKALQAWDNDTDYYTCIATGKTFSIKDDLQSWAFFWDAEKKAWVNDCVTEWEKFLFERYVIDGGWKDGGWFGVNLEFIKNPDSISE
jgi:hypothetical protein